jgi:hypothetical protein
MIYHVKWDPCHHCMAHPPVGVVGDGLQIRRVAVIILNKQLRAAEKTWSFSLGGWEWGDNSSL